MPRLLLAAAAAVLLVTMTGCGDPVVPPSPSPTPTATPVFASEEEALAAAVAAYGRYLEVSDAIATDGGHDVGRLEGLVTLQQYQQAAADFDELASSGRHMNGRSSFDSVAIQQFRDTNVSVYLCLDVSAVRVLDGAGIDVTPSDRESRIPLDISFAVADGSLLLDTSDVWEGNGLCAN